MEAQRSSHNYCNNLTSANTPSHSTAILDSGASGHYLLCTSPCRNKQPITNGLEVKLPNNATLTSTHTAEIQLDGVPSGAMQAHIFPQLGNALISVGQLCDYGCETSFNATECNVTNRLGRCVLRGPRDQRTGLWRVDLAAPTGALPSQNPQPPVQHELNSVYHTKTKRELVQYLHAACGSPVPSTWIKAIENGNFATWPGLTTALVRKYLPESVATAKGHLHHIRQHIRSTQPLEDKVPSPSSHRQRTHHVTVKAIELNGAISTDATGGFPKTSRRGNKYIYVLYDHDSNAILVEPLKSRKDAEIIRAFNKLHEYLAERGLKPVFNKLDNEASAAFKANLRQRKIEYQLAPPNSHRTLPGERHIQTFKNHFIACLATADPSFPLVDWDLLLDHAQVTLNLLRNSNINPRLSAYAQMEGVFDYNKTPVGPVGCRALIYETPEQRPTFAFHGEEGWYIGPAMEHYRCHRVLVTKTRAERIGDTVKFYPKFPMPTLSTEQSLLTATLDLLATLKKPNPLAIPNGNAHQQVLRQLSELFTPAPPAPMKNTDPPPRVQMETPQHPRVPALQHQAPKVRLQAPRDPVSEPQAPSPTSERPTGHRTRQSTGTPTAPPARFSPSANAVIHPETGQKLEYRHLIKIPGMKDIWEKSFANEIGRLAQGVGGRIKGSNSIFFIRRNQIPPGRKVTYTKLVCDIRPQKAETHRTRMTAGGDKLEYGGNASTHTVDLPTTKLLFNSVISTKNARFCCLDIKDYYLGTPMDTYEYMRIKADLMPKEIMDEYDLWNMIEDDGYLYMEVRKAIYGLIQAGKLAFEQLKKRLAKHGYRPVRHTVGLWRHDRLPTKFVLCVDDFGVKYIGKDNMEHLINALKQEGYVITVDWTGTKYLGMTLDWDYENRTVDVSMPGYVEAALHELQHPNPKKPQRAPSEWKAPVYGSKIQLTKPNDDSPPMSPEANKRLQVSNGKFLYYSRACDPTMLHQLSTLAAQQGHGTEKTAKALKIFLDYCATNPDAKLHYIATDMLLKIISDAAFLTEPKARSRVGGHHFLGNREDKSQVLNAPVHSTSKVLKNVVGSATEAEVGGVYHNARDGVPLRTALEEMGHPQPSTPIITDNTTAHGILNRTVKQQRSKAIDMRFYWVQDRIDQGQYHLVWAPGDSNLADYFTKHHSEAHHRRMRPIILNHMPQHLVQKYLQGCVKSRGNPGRATPPTGTTSTSTHA